MSLRVVHMHGRAAGRLLFVGDIHGCVDQLRELLVKACFTNAAVRRCPALLTPSSLASSHFTAASGSSRSGDSVMCIPDALKPDPLTESVGMTSASPSTEADAADDVCIFVGDLVNKGPDSYGVVRCLRDIGAIGVLGNHDAKLLQLAEKLRSNAPLSDREASSSLYPLAVHCPDDVLASMASIPHILCFHAYRLIVVHAGIDPSIPLAAQSVEAVMCMRNLLKAEHYWRQPIDETTGKPAHVALSVSAAFATLERPKLGSSWSVTWSKLARKLRCPVAIEGESDGGQSDSVSGSGSDAGADDSFKKRVSKKARESETKWRERIHPDYAGFTIVYGHDAKRRLQVYPHVFGLDSGCVYGGELTGLVWPSTLVSVPGWANPSPPHKSKV
ncbi:hypothetical protein GH5_06770 [Leishmania sp. Ghana 2012 LV757]|uniref:hypothetical protein n=1 Tax=Leishmania sp. Ghana 2012 LV757 TaxID=2803181 RepID=UPI001B6AB359|nr:hypothetical protein GH5_06770 [Leishmania sp. Ghana 2012 LV757]